MYVFPATETKGNPLTSQCLTIIFFISSSSSSSGSSIQTASDILKDKWKGESQTPASDLANELSSKVQDTLQDAEEVIKAPTTPKQSPPKVPAKPVDKVTPPKEKETSVSEPSYAKMNATFVTLARNNDLWEIVKSIRHVEDRFNRKYHYDWVFLNEKPFDDEFKRVTTALVSGTARYGLIGEEHWSFPEWIDQDKAAAVRKDMSDRKIIYGDSISYRHMCRFESGFFFRQPLMLEYEWYWRVEPSIDLFCDIDYDAFKFMADNGKKYSFVLSLYEYKETIPTLWDSTRKFMKEHPEHIAAGNSMEWLSDDGGYTYNNCHFVSLPFRLSLETSS